MHACKHGVRTLDISAMTERNSALGCTTGLSVDSSTALVYRSSVRKHTSFSPNCCSSVSPCTTPHATLVGARHHVETHMSRRRPVPPSGLAFKEAACNSSQQHKCMPTPPSSTANKALHALNARLPELQVSRVEDM